MAVNQPGTYHITVRHARLDDIPLLANIETSAATLLRTVSSVAWIADMPPMEPEVLRPMTLQSHVWVAATSVDDQLVAFSAAEPKDGLFYIEELSVYAAWQRKGLARRLIAAMEQQARCEGFPYVSLTTYRDLPWNAPFYERVGFCQVEPTIAGVEHVRELRDQAAKGHNVSTRCVMWKCL